MSKGHVVRSPAGVCSRSPAMGPLLRSGALHRSPLRLSRRLLRRRQAGISRRDSWNEARVLPDVAVAGIVDSIKDLCLRVAPQKTEAVFMYSGVRRTSPSAWVLVPVATQIKYLGLQLDGRWRFSPYFEYAASRVARIGGAVASLMRNTGGLSWRVRRLYLSVVASVALYAVSVWATALEASGRGKALLRRRPPEGGLMLSQSRSRRRRSCSASPPPPFGVSNIAVRSGLRAAAGTPEGG